MANTLNLQGFSNLNLLAQTSLTSDVPASTSSLPVGNNADFSGGGHVIVGGVGDPTTEMLLATTPNDATSIPLSAGTSLPHSFEDTVTLLFGNQLRIYRADDVYGNGVQPPDANFTLLAGGTINIRANNLLTRYTDPTGVSGQWYKYTYYNSTTQAETQLSDSRAVRAGVVHYVSLDQVRQAAGFSGAPKVTDDKIAEFRDRAELEINGRLTAVYQFPLPQPTNPIIVAIARDIAAGELRHQEYINVDPNVAKAAMAMADKARHGDSKDSRHTSLDDLVSRSVILEDANYNELASDEGNGIFGWPDETTALNTVGPYATPPAGFDRGPQATINEEF